MALSKAQQVALFNILKVTWVGDVYLLEDRYHQVNIKISVSPGERQTITQLMAYITDIISGDADFETEVKTKLDRWLALGTQNWTLAGGVGSVSGMNMSPALERQEIERQIILMVPFIDPERSTLGTGSSFQRNVPLIS